MPSPYTSTCPFEEFGELLGPGALAWESDASFGQKHPSFCIRVAPEGPSGLLGLLRWNMGPAGPGDLGSRVSEKPRRVLGGLQNEDSFWLEMAVLLYRTPGFPKRTLVLARFARCRSPRPCGARSSLFCWRIVWSLHPVLIYSLLAGDGCGYPAERFPHAASSCPFAPAGCRVARRTPVCPV